MRRLSSTEKSSADDSFDEAETARRRDAIIKNMIATPPKPHAPSKDKRKRVKTKQTTTKR